MYRLAACASAVLSIAGTPSEAAAYHCDLLQQKVMRSGTAVDIAERQLADVAAKTETGEFDEQDLRGARQTYEAYRARHKAAHEEIDEHCTTETDGEKGVVCLSGEKPTSLI